MRTRLLSLVTCGVLASVVSSGQIGKITQQDWVTSSADAQRTSWIRSDAFISPESMQTPGFRMQWKVTLDNQGRQMHALRSGVVIGNLGFGSIPLSFISGSANRVFAVDNDTGAIFWQRTFEPGAGGAGTMECPGGITSAATRPATLMPTIPVWRGVQDRPAYSGGVGAPGEGVPAYLMGRAGRAATPAPAPTGNTAPAGAPPPANAPARGPAPPQPPPVVYALSNDGRLHTLGLYTGKDTARPIVFLPANAHVSDLIALNDVVYAAAMNGCGGVANGMWSVDLAGDAHTVRSWKTEDGSPIGPPAFGSDGTVYVTVGPGASTGSRGYANAVVALRAGDLTLKDWFSLPGTELATLPVVFRTGDREILAVAARDGSIVLLDAASLGGSTHTVMLGRSAASSDRGGLLPGGLATWEDSTGTRWLLLPTATSVSALKVTSGNGTLTLQPGWTSRQMRTPVTPVVVNGVAFVVSSGEFVPPAGATVSAADRARQSVPAVLYAFDAATGRELWSSGTSMTSFLHGPLVWPGIGQIHVATYDGTVYAFGFTMERY